MCAQATCSVELQAAHDACAADPTSDACHAAQDAVHTCVQPCHDDLTAALEVCRSDGQTCVASCPHPGTVQSKDPLCVGQCRADFQACRSMARKDTEACHLACQPLVAAARTACAADSSSDACHRARQAAGRCERACVEAHEIALHACLRTAYECVEACPNSSQP
jgi:hypothetical protein